MAPIPLKGVGVPLVAVAGQAGRYAVFGDAQAPPALGMDVVNRFRGFAAVDATSIGDEVKGLAPASDAQLGT